MGQYYLSCDMCNVYKSIVAEIAGHDGYKNACSDCYTDYLVRVESFGKPKETDESH